MSAAEIPHITLTWWQLTFKTAQTQTHAHAHTQGDQKVSVHLMITAQKTCKNILNSFNHLP
jgi:hypothetical protein